MSAHTRKLWTIIEQFHRRYPHVADGAGCLAAAWFFAAFVCMFFTNRYPFLHPFVKLTFYLWLGIPLAGIVGLIVVGPTAYITQSLIDNILDPSISVLEKRLTIAWCVVAGVLFSATTAIFLYLELAGTLSNVKMWFVAVCYCVILVPWALVGILSRKIVRHFHPPNRAYNRNLP